MPDLTGKLTTPFNNIVSASEYIETAQSDIQWRDRVWKVAEDTATINGLCEFGGDLGAFTAGTVANKIAEGYTDEAIQTLVTLNDQEKLNFEIFQQTARDKNIDPASIRGTGLSMCLTICKEISVTVRIETHAQNH